MNAVEKKLQGCNNKLGYVYLTYSCTKAAIGGVKGGNLHTKFDSALLFQVLFFGVDLPM